MQINAIQSISSPGATSIFIAPPKPARVANRSAVAASLEPAHAAVPASSPAPPQPRPSGSRGGGSVESQSDSTASAAEDVLAAVYSTTVDGQTYSGSVEESDGEYTASVANLPDASASGSSVEAAEDNLGTVIDALA